jgi:hypothetical protein
MTSDLPSTARTTQSDGTEAAGGPEKPGASISEDYSGRKGRPRAKLRGVSKLHITGFADNFTWPNILGGWAQKERSSDPLDVRVLLEGKVIGTGRTGQKRLEPAGNCGFCVTLSQPITAADIRSNAVKVYAVDTGGDAHELPMLASHLLRVSGFVDFLPIRSPNLLVGWAREEGSEDPLDVRVLLDGILIGTGQTGQRRLEPAGNCGFCVTLSRPVTVADIRSNAVKVYAVDTGGDAHELPIWPRLLGSVSSSAPLELHLEQEALYREVLTLLEEKRVPFAVAGTFALRQHTGISRFIKDLDLCLTAETALGALAYLKQDGFETEILDPVWLAHVGRNDVFVDLITGADNAAIVVEDSWIRRAQPAVINGVRTRVLAPEELIASKLFLARRKRFDGADVAHLIYGTHGKIEWDRMLEVAGEHWEMLLWALIFFRYVYPAHAHYVPAAVWQDLLARFQKAIAGPDPHARFRGSLVDENIFAIDVQEWGLDNVLAEYRANRLATIKAQTGTAL